MIKDQVQLYYKNVTEEVLGSDNGISESSMSQIASRAIDAVKAANQARKDGQTPYRDLPYREDILEQVNNLADKFRPGCENLVVLGIGGSALGNIALQTALNPYIYNIDENRGGPRLFVFDNVDPSQLSSFLGWIEDKLDKTIFNVISKSGRTAETASQFLIIRKFLTDRLGAGCLKERIVATTDPSSGTLRKIADAEELCCLDVPDGVGGRFSVLSAVGLFSAAMCGIDIDQLYAGARDMDVRVSVEHFVHNAAAINAAINYYYYNHGKKMSVIMPYSYALKDMADWYRQLWAESLGKRYDVDGNEVFVGPTPIKALGATDQHSQVQLYREGPDDKLFTFLEVEDLGSKVNIPETPDNAPELGYLCGKDMGKLLNSEKQGTEYALLNDGRPCLTVKFPRINAYTVGQFIYLFEVTTSIMGRMLNINTYDQPAVELGKEATFALMDRKGEYKESMSFEQFAEKIKNLTQVDDKYLV